MIIEYICYTISLSSEGSNHIIRIMMTELEDVAEGLTFNAVIN